MARPSVAAKCLRIDDPVPGTTYFGYAIPGTLSTEAAWRIVRLTTIGTATLIEYADGGTDSTYVWDDRLSYTYL